MGKTVDLSLLRREGFSASGCFSHRRWSGFLLVINYIVAWLCHLSCSQQWPCRKRSVDWEELGICCLEALYKLSRIGAAAWIALLAYPITQVGWPTWREK